MHGTLSGSGSRRQRRRVVGGSPVYGRPLAHIRSRRRRAHTAADLVMGAGLLTSPTIVQAAAICGVPTWEVARVLRARGHRQYRNGNGNGNGNGHRAPVDPAIDALVVDALIAERGVEFVWDRIAAVVS